MSVEIITTEIPTQALGDKVVVFFFAEWHEPSKSGGQMDSVCTLLANQYPAIKFVKVEAEKIPTMSEKFKISAVPTFVLLHGNNIYLKIEGDNPAELNKSIGKLNEMPPPPPELVILPHIYNFYRYVY